MRLSDPRCIGVSLLSILRLAEVSNVKVFRSLQMHPTCGGFFSTFGDGGIHDLGELEVGEKFAEGGQAELYNSRVSWKNPKYNFEFPKLGFKFVLKVFRKGTSLRDLQKQWPDGMFRYCEERLKHRRCGETLPERRISNTVCGTLLRDGRFAFLMLRESEDLRTLIDRCMKARACIDSRPFSRECVILIMYKDAKGMADLHNFNIVLRDLKASNVLCSPRKIDTYSYHVANVEVAIRRGVSFSVVDLECSIGVVGTSFFRAPEILQALKDKVVNKNPSVFTKEADIYSYGMLCYELLTRKLPFGGHHINDYDLVLGRSQPEVPKYVEEWARDLLYKCWAIKSWS